MSVEWVPADRKPRDVAELERLIDDAVPQCQVKALWESERWQVRALAPQASCGRGRGFANRDVSARVAEILQDAGHPARAR